MTGVPLPAKDVLAPGPHRDLVEALHELYRQAGLPGTRTISQDSRELGDVLALRDTISHEGVSGVLRGVGIPRWSKLECLVRILVNRAVDHPDLDATLQRFHKLWRSAAGVGAAEIMPAEARLLTAQAITTAENAEQLARRLARQGDADGLRQLLKAGNESAATYLVDLLLRRGDIEGLRQQADMGNAAAVVPLARLLDQQGDVHGLRRAADAGNESAARRLVEQLFRRGDIEGLRQQAGGDRYAATALAALLADRGDMEGLRRLADAGSKYAARRIAELLAERSDVEALRQEAEAGNKYAADQVLAKEGDVKALRARADTGNKYAAELLNNLLAKPRSS
jgi:hypothetical protein